MTTGTTDSMQRRRQVFDLAERLGNISEACRQMGISRTTFYYYRKIREVEGEAALFCIRHKKANIKNRVSAAIENAVLAYAREHPLHGQQRASEALKKRGIVVSPTGVRCIWKRHGLETSRKRCSSAKQEREDIVFQDAETDLK